MTDETYEHIIAGKFDTEIYQLATHIYNKHFKLRSDLYSEDMIQIAVIYLWEKRDLFDRERHGLHTWIYTCLHYGFRMARLTMRRMLHEQ